MIVGIGLDSVDIARFSAVLARHGERFLARVFTDRERADAADRADGLLSLAARFAAKEAAMKALGSGWSGGVGFRQIEIARADGGAPQLRLYGRAAQRAADRGARRFHVSLTHQPSSAAAVVILETD